jgi:hypothetical protein
LLDQEPPAVKTQSRDFVKVILLFGIIFLAGCTYSVLLVPHPTVAGNPLPVSADITIPDQTTKYTFDVTSATAGAANTYRI